MKSLCDFKSLNQNSSIIVCGCGESLNGLARPERFITIGVNDVGRKFQPNYLVVVNPRNQFSGDRFRFVENSQAEYLFTQLDLGVNHPNIVKFQLGTFGGTDFSNPNVLHYTNNSPYIALCLAILMGAKRIGLIGVDFTDDHFFEKTGRHPLAPQFDSINEQYCRLREAAKSLGIEIYNLSKISRLTAFPKISVEEFENPHQPESEIIKKSDSLKIVSYATTPVAGVPAILARCINAQTPNSARCVWATKSYGNGVEFAGDVEWQNQPQTAEDLLAEADLVIVHNGKSAPQHERSFKDKAVITMAHNYLWNVDERFVRQGFAGVVVGQYQAALGEFTDWLVVPNPVPFWEEEYKRREKNGQITICYTPSGKHEKYPFDHRLYWHSKGFETTVRILEKLSKQFPINLEIIKDQQISHAESLAMKRRSHIVIDECVTGSYHRNSLEGLACGAVVVNGLGILPKVEDILRFCASDAKGSPFVSATLENLEEVLTRLIESGHENLVRKGAENRQWFENHWNFSNQWQKFWLPAIEKSFKVVNRKAGFVSSGNKEANKILSGEAFVNKKMNEFKEGVSIVIPHGGRVRLPHLRTCLANIRQCKDVGEIIVVEMDKTAEAEKIARKWADKYVFLQKTDSFERAETLNIGSAFAECEFILWLDNDLLVEPDFISRALGEIRQRNLDFLKPYWEVRYLSLDDSEKVMQGSLNPAECRPANAYSSSLTDGGAGLVHQEFLHKYGGIPAGFRGWGGEDNGWMHKVGLLGRGGRTELADQKVFHLYHALSGGYGGSVHIEANPHYQSNLALLRDIKKTRKPSEIVANFPPASLRLFNATPRNILFVSDDAGADVSTGTAQELNTIFGSEIGNLPYSVVKKTAKSWLRNSPDAVVFFDYRNALDFLSKKTFEAFSEKILIVADKRCAGSAEQQLKLRNIGGVLALDEATAANFKKLNVKTWLSNGDVVNDFRSLALALAQPLSLLVNGQTKSAKADKKAGDHQTTIPDLPIWLYWEGHCPDWIQACQKSILAHLPKARLLTPESFGELWTEDRDINIADLHVAHRADFIRAFLLKKYGGVWIDSDCVMLRSLESLLETFDGYDFAAHRERGGYFGNEFMIAKQGSRIAEVFYEQICRTLRTVKDFGWCGLGCVPLTDVINRTDAAFLEIDCELIQPICWSVVEPYFTLADDAAHFGGFRQDAICYMLSNLTLQKYLAANPHQDLLAENSFFSFLVRRSMHQNASGISSNSQNGNGFTMPNTYQNGGGERRLEIGFYLEMMEKLSPKKVLDLDVGFGRWGVLLRDLFETSTDKKDWKISVEAIIDAKNGTKKELTGFYDNVRFGGPENIKEKRDLIILGDYLKRNFGVQSNQILKKTLEMSDYVLLNLPVDEHGGGDFLELHTEQVTAQKFHGKNRGISVLLSKTDPKKLRVQSEMKEIFDKAAQHCRQIKLESASGPGSSLAQTAEIRRRLPILFAYLDVNSMLDAPCGDFNWLRHVDLRLDKYCGIDIVPSIIEQNQRDYDNQQRKFRFMDITCDLLPRQDLILCRDCLVHLSFAEIFAALRNFCLSGAKYLLTTTFPDTQINSDIKTGDWRTLNFALPPFSFPAPLHLINEHCAENNGHYADKSLGLWLISDICKVLG